VSLDILSQSHAASCGERSRSGMAVYTVGAMSYES
jgi:hypothetical protein